MPLSFPPKYNTLSNNSGEYSCSCSTRPKLNPQGKLLKHSHGPQLLLFSLLARYLSQRHVEFKVQLRVK